MFAKVSTTWERKRKRGEHWIIIGSGGIPTARLSGEHRLLNEPRAARWKDGGAFKEAATIKDASGNNKGETLPLVLTVRKLLLALTSRSSRCFAQVWLLFVALPLNLLATAHFQLTSTTGWKQFGQKLPLGSLWRAAFGGSAFGGIWKSSSYPSYWLRGRGALFVAYRGWNWHLACQDIRWGHKTLASHNDKAEYRGLCLCLL